MEKRRRGRPRKYADGAERIRSYRKRKQAEGRRLDVYISLRASTHLTKLAKAWGCSPSRVIERLLLDANKRYRDILRSEPPGPVD